MRLGRPTRSLFVVLKLLLGLVYLGPLVWILITSLKTNAQVLQNPNALIFSPTLDTYRTIISSGLGAIVTSLQIGVIVTAVVLLDDEEVATGMGLSKKQAEQLAAERALAVLGVV